MVRADLGAETFPMDTTITIATLEVAALEVLRILILYELRWQYRLARRVHTQREIVNYPKPKPV